MFSFSLNQKVSNYPLNPPPARLVTHKTLKSKVTKLWLRSKYLGNCCSRTCSVSQGNCNHGVLDFKSRRISVAREKRPICKSNAEAGHNGQYIVPNSLQCPYCNRSLKSPCQDRSNQPSMDTQTMNKFTAIFAREGLSSSSLLSLLSSPWRRLTKVLLNVSTLSSLWTTVVKRVVKGGVLQPRFQGLLLFPYGGKSRRPWERGWGVLITFH